MTGKSPFAERICQACAETKRALEFEKLAAALEQDLPAAYGTEDVSTIISRFFLSLQRRKITGRTWKSGSRKSRYSTILYKIDESVYHGAVFIAWIKNNGRITAKDVSPDINDPQKELYGLIYRGLYDSVGESRARLNNARFLSRVQARGTSDLTAGGKMRASDRCCETIGGKKAAERDASWLRRINFIRLSKERG